MSVPDLGAIQARADAATEGPWMRRSDHVVVQVSHSTGEQLSAVVYGPAYGADAEFIANARTDVPALLALVREQQARIEKARALMEAAIEEYGYGVEIRHSDLEPIRAALTATEGA